MTNEAHVSETTLETAPSRSGQTAKLDPQPHDVVALGFWKTNPRPMISSLKSIVVPSR